MRKIILCLIFFIYIPTYSYAEEYRKYALFDSYTNSIHTSIVATQDGNHVAIGQYNKEIRNIAISDQIELFFQNKNFIFQVNKVERGYQKITFSAENIQENGFLTVAVNRDKLVGSLIYAGESYRFRPGSNGATLITKLTNAVQLDNDVKYHALVSADTYQPDRSISGATPDSGAEYTVIIAFTNRFKKNIGGSDAAIAAYMSLLEEGTNMSYKKSNINTRVKIIYFYQSDYDGEGVTHTDLDYFTDIHNPDSMQLNRLRDQHKADIKFILTSGPDNPYQISTCGIARGIGVDESNAIAIMRSDCGVGSVIFAHEIGHLFGARHERNADPLNTPFPYGHGYCAGLWSTIMSPGCAEASIPIWSNPDILIKNQPAGTDEYENNARVINTRAYEVANFR